MSHGFYYYGEELEMIIQVVQVNCFKKEYYFIGEEEEAQCHVVINIVLLRCRLVGKVAADNSHKWVFGDASNECDSNFISSWNLSIEPVGLI